MWLGILFGVGAGFLWGITYLLPLALSLYDPLYIALGRCTVMGGTAVAGLWLQRKFLKDLALSDWKAAFALTMIGNVIQSWTIFLSVEYAGAVIAGMCFGLCPVLIALIANERDKRKGKPFLPLIRLTLPLAMLFIGLVLANSSELSDFIRAGRDPVQFFIGLAFGLSSTAMWTWYPIRNADWLLDHPKVSPVFWTNFQCAILLPVGAALFAFASFVRGDLAGPLGPEPLKFAGWMLLAGIFCSWGATALWNAMSQRVPTALAGQMLVVESIFSIIFAHLWNWKLPTLTLIAGVLLMIGGISWSLALFSSAKGKAPAAES